MSNICHQMPSVSLFLSFQQGRSICKQYSLDSPTQRRSHIYNQEQTLDRVEVIPTWTVDLHKYGSVLAGIPLLFWEH